MLVRPEGEWGVALVLPLDRTHDQVRTVRCTAVAEQPLERGERGLDFFEPLRIGTDRRDLSPSNSCMSIMVGTLGGA